MTELEKLKISEKLRQFILDLSHATGPITNMDVVRATKYGDSSGVSESRVQQTTLNMLKNGELSREWRKKVAYYTAIVDKTESAESVYERSIRQRSEGVSKTRRAQSAARKKNQTMKFGCWVNGRYTNADPERSNQQCPDAMGSRGMDWGIQSSMA